MSKRRALKALAAKRKKTRLPGYKCIGDYRNGAYDCEHVSPYTKSAGNVNSPIMVMLQDWTSQDKIRRGLDAETLKLGYYPNLRTNKKLVQLLEEHFNTDLKRIFATNLFPYIKRGKINSAIPARDLVWAASEFGIPQIKIVRPKLVICLGLATFNALREAQGEKPVFPTAAAIRLRPRFQIGKAVIWCQAHTAPQGQATRNTGRKRVPGDWRRMAKWLRKG